jgi:hypothetical protein
VNATSSRTLALWLVPIVVLLAYGGYMTDWGRQLVGNEVNWRKVTTPPVSTGVVPDIAFNADASPYAAVTDHNVFAPWRKPAPPAEAPKGPVEPPKPQIRRGIYTLTGTIALGEDVIATVKETATGRTKQVRRGEQLQEYLVEKIESDRVFLAFAGQTEELALAKFTQSGRASVSVPVAPQAVPAVLPPGMAPPGVAPPGAAPQMPPQGQGRPVAGQPGANVVPVPIPNAPGSIAPFPPSVTTPPGGTPQSTPAQTPPVSTVPTAQTPPPEVIDVGELLRRRREARNQ